MILQHRLLLALLIMSVNHGASVAPTYGSDLSEFLRAVFENHHQRPPTGAEINHYSNLSRNAGPLESYIAMVGSDDYFISQCQRDSQVYTRRLYQLFLHRDPQPDELRFWVNQYQSSRVDRVSFVRQFCQANNISAVPGSPLPYRPASRPPSNAVYSADALAIDVGEDADSVRAFVEKQKYTHPVVLDPKQQATAAYRITSLPVTVLIGKNGTVQAVHVGTSLEERALIRADMEALVAGKQLVTAEQH